jgi:hypothetical protein
MIMSRTPGNGKETIAQKRMLLYFGHEKRRERITTEPQRPEGEVTEIR